MPKFYLILKFLKEIKSMNDILTLNTRIIKVLFGKTEENHEKYQTVPANT
jgi:hypothetical protein